MGSEMCIRDRWWVASNAGWVSRVFLPTPQATLASLAEGLRADLLDFTWATVSRMLLGWLLASLVGVAVALVVAVTVEIAANPHGMGYAMMIAQQSFDPALMLAWLGWIGIVGYAINAAMQWLQRRVARRMGATP